MGLPEARVDHELLLLWWHRSNGHAKGVTAVPGGPTNTNRKIAAPPVTAVTPSLFSLFLYNNYQITAVFWSRMLFLHAAGTRGVFLRNSTPKFDHDGNTLRNTIGVYPVNSAPPHWRCLASVSRCRPPCRSSGEHPGTRYV